MWLQPKKHPAGILLLWQNSPQLIFLYHLCLFYGTILFYTTWQKGKKQTNNNKRTCWLHRPETAIVSGQHQQQWEENKGGARQNEGPAGLQWTVAVNVNNGEEQHTMRGDHRGSPPEHGPGSEFTFRGLYSTEPSMSLVHCPCRISCCHGSVNISWTTFMQSQFVF